MTTIRFAESVRHKLHDRFGLLLSSLVASFLVTGIETWRWATLVAALLNLLSLIVGFASTNIDLKGPLFASVAFVGLVGTAMLSVSTDNELGTALGATGQVFVLSTLTLAVLARVVSDTRVTTQTILGAVAAYFLIGQVFAWIYLALPGYIGTAVLEPPGSGLPLYYSYIVLTTVGFGDITPVGTIAQRVTVVEALLGQMFLAVLVARLVSVYSSGRAKD